MRLSVSGIVWCVVVLVLTIASPVLAEEAGVQAGPHVSEGISAEGEQYAPTRYGAAVSYAQSYLPDADLGYVQLWGFVQWDYDRIWPHAAPEGLRFKAEATAGLSTAPYRRFLGSAGIMAQYYIEALETESARWFIEGGVHGIYTDFRLEGQGLRFNFNPQVGAGFDFGKDRDYTLALRLHHVSNAGLDDDNDGFNAAVILLGAYF